MARPNIVAGLLAERGELAALRANAEAEPRKVVCDLDHFDAAVRLLNPEQTPAAVARYATRHPAGKGQLRRFVLERLSGAAAPATSREVTAACVTRGGCGATTACSWCCASGSARA